MATELSELTNLLKAENQNNNSNFKSLENAVESSFSRMSNSLSGIRTIEEQQLALIKDTASKEIMGEQLIEKDIAKGDREIVNSLKEIFQVLQEQFDFDRDTENKRKLSEHVQKDYQSDTASKVDMGGVENLLRKLIDVTRDKDVSLIGNVVESVASGWGISKIFGMLKDISLKLLQFIGKFPMLSSIAGAGIMGATGGSLTGAVASGAIAGAARGGIPGALAGGAAGAVGWGAGRVFSREKDSDPRIGRWDDVEYGTSKKKFEFKPEIASVLKETAEKTGVDENYLRTMAHIESKGNPRAFNQGSKAAGLFQFIPSTAKMYGLRGKEFDPRASTEAAAKLTLSNKSALEKAGIEATPEMLYIAHQQGSKGAIDLVKYAKEGRDFSQLPGGLQRNIKSNVPGRKALGAEEFLDFWKTSYKQHAAVAGLKNESSTKEEPSLIDRGVDKLKKWTGIGDEPPSTSNLSITGTAKDRGISKVNPQLVDILNETAKNSNYKVELFSGLRPGDKRFHGKGMATDISLIDPKTGKKLGNYQDPAAFRAYEEFAQKAKAVQMAKYPELEKQFRWGGYFSGGKGKYGAADLMHFDVGGSNKLGMAGGSWEKGLTSSQRKLWKGAESVGMGNREEWIAKNMPHLLKGEQTYAKMEKQIPEGGKYKEEESEMEETDEPILEEKVSEPKSKLTEEKPNFDKKIDSGYKGFFEDMVSHLEKMVSFTEEIKNSNKKMADTESEKQSETAKKEESTKEEEKPTASKQDKEAEKVMDDLFSEDEPTKRSQEGKLSPEYRKELEEKYKDMDPAERELMIKETEDALNRSIEPGVDRVTSESPGSFKVDAQKPSYSQDQSTKEANLMSDKEKLSNIGVNPFGGPGIFGGMGQTIGGFGQNPFRTIQNVLGSVGSAVSTGQQIGNMGSGGGIGAVQGALGGIQGVMRQIGQQSPMLGGLGQVLGSVGSAISTGQQIGNMGSGGGIGAVQGALGSVGSAVSTGQQIGNMGSGGGIGAAQGVLGSVGSAVSTGQQIGNIGKYGMGSGGGIGAAQGVLGGIQGVMRQIGQQSPMLGGLGQVLGSVGSVAGSIQGMKNMGGAGGILGGINAASGVIGAAGNIFNAGKGILGGMGGLFGGESSEKTGNMIKDNPMLKGMANSVGDFFGIRSVGKERTDDLSDPSKWHPIESKGIGDDAAAVKAKNEPEDDSNFFNDRIREVYGENKGLSNNKSSASLMPSVSTDGFSLEGMSKDVEAGKEEMMMPTGGGEPVVVNAGGGGGGAGGGGGGGNSQENPSSTGVMGIDIGVRNEEATLMRAQFGSVRIV